MAKSCDLTRSSQPADCDSRCRGCLIRRCGEQSIALDAPGPLLDWGVVKLSFRATAGRHLSARGGTGRLSAVREGRHPDHRGLFCRGRHPDDRWRAERNGHSVRGEPRARHHLYHGFHERRRRSRGRRNPSNPHHASVASTAIQQRTFDLLGVPLRLA